MRNPMRRLGSPLGHGRVARKVDPLGLFGAMAEVGSRTALDALPKRALGLGLELTKVLTGKSAVAPNAKDWRFTNRAWQDNPGLRRLAQAYLAWCRAAMDLVDDAELDWRTAERAKLATTLVTSTLAPTNMPLLNPDAVERAYETGGMSIVRGVANLSRDIMTNRGIPRQVKAEDLVVGRDLALTPGAVVFRTEVLELLEYTPQTETVHPVPLVMVPPQINKYYFMDLAPGRSFVEFCVRQGFRMFAISWRNPTREHWHWGLDAYIDALDAAARAAADIAGTNQVNTVSLCAGGITTAAWAGHLASRGDDLLGCATFAVTLLDFSVPTTIGLFSSPHVVASAREQSQRLGVVGGKDATVLFSLLRPNDLIWNYWVRSNLLGEELPPFDLLTWNTDATRLPAALHSDFLDMFSRNSLAQGEHRVDGNPVDLGQVECDSFVVGARTDHLTPWNACYAATQLLGGDSQFALSSSGHIQSLVNPPGNAKMTVATAPATASSPDEWLAGVTPEPGSWWEPWSRWCAERSGERRPAPTSLGDAAHPPLEPAPGRYVLQP